MTRESDSVARPARPGDGAYAHQFTAKLAEVFPDKDRSTAWFGLFDTDSCVPPPRDPQPPSPRDPQPALRANSNPPLRNFPPASQK